MGTSGISGSMGSAGGSGCPSSVQALADQEEARGRGPAGVTTGRTTMGLSLEPLAAYHRSSGGMRLIRDFSSSAASRESSVRKRTLRSLTLRSWNLVVILGL